jgi:hypothetical protein
MCVIMCVHISQGRASAPAATPGSSRQRLESTRRARTASSALRWMPLPSTRAPAVRPGSTRRQQVMKVCSCEGERGKANTLYTYMHTNMQKKMPQTNGFHERNAANKRFPRTKCRKQTVSTNEMPQTNGFHEQSICFLLSLSLYTYTHTYCIHTYECDNECS